MKPYFIPLTILFFDSKYVKNRAKKEFTITTYILLKYYFFVFKQFAIYIIHLVAEVISS